jgi:predicted CXXCH cytochrome family protein
MRATKVMGLAAVAALALGCAKLEKEKLAVVTTAGPHALEVGKTLTVTATTANGTDATYAWESSAPAIATVDAKTGVVTGVKAGEAEVRATGATTGAVGKHALVVFDKATTMEPPQPNVTDLVPYYEKWMMSAHADKTAVPFNNWNMQGTIPVECARCHSSPGFMDYLGADGSMAGKVDQPAPTGTVITCKACHNPAADALTSVTFPSGATVTGLGGEARCMTCHQGRASGKDVDAAIKSAGLTDADTPSPMLKFTNVHYFPAAATLYASRADGGYQYPGQTYDARFRHVPGYDKCTGCHDQHSLKVKFDECSKCHQGVTDVEGARKIRMMSSATRDYDGDGDLSEGIYGELDGLRTKLLAAITGYGKEKKTPVCYSAEAYPYWFIDTNGDGTCGADETKAANGFASWTARLSKAAFNYQLSVKDPGNFAHNAKYVMELLYDSITDVNAALVAKVDMTRATRTDFGHFNGASEAARHWDANDKVDATCSRCHAGSSGFLFYQTYGVSTEVPDSANGLDCATCHESFGTEFKVRQIAQVNFPSGVVAKLPGNDNLCSSCHAGREAKATIDVALKGTPKFVNVHYLPAGSTKLGVQAHLGYEYDGATYAGPLTHPGGTQCTSCHDPVATKHTFAIDDAFDARCKTCHADANGNARAIRLRHKADYDGDANVTEPLADEIDGMATKLLGAMQAKAGPGSLCYGPGVYPYFFKDSDLDGKPFCSAAESVATNAFTAWTAELVKAAHNFQISRVEPGAWAHNFDYMAQLLFDSTVALKGDGAGMTRP